MAYEYAKERAHVFTDEGQRMFLRIRDKSKRLLAESGAFRFGELMNGIGGDTWFMLACIDRLVELGELREITDGSVIGQSRVFVGN